MTVPTTTPTAYGSVERYTETLRKYDNRADLNSALIGILEAAADARFNTDAEALRFVRNALTAADLVRGEQAGDRA